MRVYAIYYGASLGARLVRSNKPKEEDYPGSRFAEGPFRNREEAHNRLRWMNTREIGA